MPFPSSCTFPRTVKRDRSFEDEPKKPALGNLATHLGRHGGVSIAVPDTASLGDTLGVTAASAKIIEFLREGNLNPAIRPTQKGFLAVFAAWILEDNLPFTTSETGGIQRLFKYMQSKFLLPSDTTVRNTWLGFTRTILKSVKSKIAISGDTWTTRSMMFPFAGTIGSWITEENTKASTFDNASVNGVLVCALSLILREKFDIRFVPENSQIRCLVHVVNLVVQKISSVVIDYYLPNKDLPFQYDPDDDPDQRELENEQFSDANIGADELDAEMLTELAAEPKKLTPLQKMTTKICASRQRCKRFKKIVADLYNDPKNVSESGRRISTLMVVRDVKHCWNYTGIMISRGVLLRRVYSTLFHTVFYSVFRRPLIKRPEFRPLLLDDDRWDLLIELGGILKVFTQVTLQMSKYTTLNLPWVLPTYEKMLKHLNSTRDNVNFLAPLPALQLRDFLHPSLGLLWFNKLEDGEDRMYKARILFTHTYDAYKKIYEYEKAASRLRDAEKPSQLRPRGYDDVPPASTMSELDLFFAAYRTHGCRNLDKPLLWWKEFGGRLKLEPYRSTAQRVSVPAHVTSKLVTTIGQRDVQYIEEPSWADGVGIIHDHHKNVNVISLTVALQDRHVTLQNEHWRERIGQCFA
ncbi:hypothetical protein C8R45DRAFT_945232 [Mycena sanguinolenta]|nr:hypothetical protein C8R45DRAFT_945232 [Mycena sanguinolenta]